MEGAGLKKPTVISFIALLFCTVFANEQPVGGDDRLRITCTTTLMSSVVRAVGGDRVNVHTVIPYGMCPGHFDLTPGEAETLRSADMILCHGFERFLDGLETGPGTKKITVQIKGNWMIPQVYLQAVTNIRDILTKAMPASEALFAERADVYSRRVIQAAETFAESIAPFQGTPAVCAGMSRELAESMGLWAVAEFARDEDVSVRALHQILTRAEEQGAVLVIDNMQSSGKVGRVIADELDVPFVMLSNFPASDSGTAGKPPYLAALSSNYSAVLRALEAEGESE